MAINTVQGKKLLVRSTLDGPIGKLIVGGFGHRLAGSFIFPAKLKPSKVMSITQNEKGLSARILELDSEIKKLNKQKKYGLMWEDKPEDIVEACKSNVPVLRLKEKKNGIDPIVTTDESNGENILIEGDNYHALSVLNYTHKGKMDVIYIDPPYNTGARDWKYNNDYVDENDAYRHSKWISMMNNRLKLSRSLLKKDGVLIVTIDKYENATLLMLLSEIFYGYDITSVVIEHNPKGLPSKNFSYSHEYAHFVTPAGQSVIGKNPEGKEDTRNLRRAGKASYRVDRPTMFYPLYVKDGNVVRVGEVPKDSYHPKTRNIICKNGEIEIWPIDDVGDERRWHFGLDSIGDHMERIEVKEKGDIQLYVTAVPARYKTVWTGGDLDAGKYGTTLVKDITGIEFPFPKSLLATLRCLESVIYTQKDALVLDFFAGSGTTGHAVLELNKRDGGNRKFILCTNNENNICEEITYKRLRGVIDGYKFKGKNKTPLYTNELSFSDLTDRHEETALEIEKAKTENKNRYDKIETEFNDGVVSIIGIKNVDGKMDGLGGNLRYYKTDLVDIDSVYKVSDDGRIKLTYRVGEMIGLREDTLNEVQKNEWWQIFEGNGKTTAIYFKEDKTKLSALVELLEKKNRPAVLYIFSWGKNEYKGEYSSENLRVEDIPEPILEVYKEINRI
jgi:adenine-specific DNA-methyltransferase